MFDDVSIEINGCSQWAPQPVKQHFNAPLQSASRRQLLGQLGPGCLRGKGHRPSFSGGGPEVL